MRLLSLSVRASAPWHDNAVCGVGCTRWRGAGGLQAATPTSRVLAFLRRIEAAISSKLAAHLIVDNYSTHKHAKVKVWSAKRPRWHIHFVLSYSSWLNLVERFFALITDEAN
jgi:hypothetical protein